MGVVGSNPAIFTSQVADFVCDIELTPVKYDASEYTATDVILFGGSDHRFDPLIFVTKASGAGRSSPRFSVHGVYFSLICDSIPEVVMLSAKKKPEVG